MRLPLDYPSMETLNWRTSSLVTQGLAPPPLFGHSAVLLSQHYLVVFGGAVCTAGKHIINGDLSILNLTSAHWSLVSSTQGTLPTPRASHACVATEGNSMLLFGGVVGAGALADDNVYQIEVNLTLEIAKSTCLPVTGRRPCSRYAHSLTTFASKVFLYGGIASTETLSDLWLFEQDHWSEIQVTGTSPSPRCYHSACSYTNHLGRDFLIIFGGRDKDQKSVGDLWTLTSISENRWKWVWVTTQTPPRHMHSMVVVGDDCFIVGGKSSESDNLPSLKVELSTCKAAAYPGYTAYRQVCFYYNNALHLFGGYQGQDCLTNCIAVIQLQSPIPTPIRRDRSPSTPHSYLPNKLHLSPFVTISRARTLEEQTRSAPVKRVALSRLMTESKKLHGRSNSPGYSIVSTASDSAHNFVVYTFLRPAETTNNGALLPVEVINALLDSAGTVIGKDPTPLELREPVKVFGGLKGQIEDLVRYFQEYGEPSDAPFAGDLDSTDYVFAGEHFGPGHTNLETMCLLLALKVKHPESVFLIRSPQPQRIHIFEAECREKYPDEPSFSMRFLSILAQMTTHFTVSNAIECNCGPYIPPKEPPDCIPEGRITLICEEETRGGLEVCDRGFTVRFASAPSLPQEPRRPGCLMVVTKALQVVPKFLPPRDFGLRSASLDPTLS